jgi:hypothetical protein
MFFDSPHYNNYDLLKSSKRDKYHFQNSTILLKAIHFLH